MQGHQALRQTLGVDPHVAGCAGAGANVFIPDVVAGQVGQRMAPGLADCGADTDRVDGSQFLTPIHHMGPIVPRLDLDDVKR